MSYSILTGDPRSVGTGNPPVDMNNVNDVLIGSGSYYNVLNTAFAGGADPTGSNDSAPAVQAALNALPSAGGAVIIPAGTFKFNSTVTVTNDQRVIGAGVGITIVTTASDISLFRMGNEQSDHIMRNWMWLSDMTVNSTGGTQTHANVKIDGGGRGTTIQRVSTGGGKYGFELMDLDRCDFYDLSANNPGTAAIFLEVGWQNTYGTITFVNCDTVLSNNNTYGFYVAANADQSGPNQPDRINFIGCMMYMSNGLTGCIGFYDKIGMTSTNFVGCLFEQNTRQYRNDGSSSGVNFLGCTFLDSTFTATDIAYLNGSGYYTFRDCRFQQATNCFNAVSNSPNLCLEGRSNFQGSISNLLTGTFGSKTGTDTPFIGDNILALGLNNQRFGYGFINNLVGNPVNIFPSTDGPGAINFLEANGTHVLASFNTSTGVFSVDAGTNSAGSAPVLTGLGAVSGTPIQLTDTTRDYLVYLNVTTAGTATSVTMGHTSGAGDVTIAQSETATLGQVYSFRLPAGWYFKWTGTGTAMGNQNAVGC